MALLYIMTSFRPEIVVPVSDKEALIPRDLWLPSWTDQRFANAPSGGVTIFVDPSVEAIQTWPNGPIVEGLDYSFEDRLEEPQFIGRKGMELAATKAEREVGNNISARYAEQLLRFAFDDPDLWIGHIKTGVSGGGHPFKIFGYRQSE